MDEPIITIQGITLTQGQAMALRVACSSFLSSLKDGLGEDEMGKKLTIAYTERVVEVLNLLLWKKQ